MVNAGDNSLEGLRVGQEALASERDRAGQFGS